MASVLLGHTSSGVVVSSGDPLFVGSGQTIKSTLILSGGYAEIDYGGDARATTILSGGQLVVFAAATGSIISAGGIEYLQGAGTDTHAIVMGTLVAGGSSTTGGGIQSGRIESGGQISVISKGTASATTVNAGGFLSVSAGSGFDTVLKGGSESVSGGGIQSDVMVGRGALLSIDGGSANGVTVAAGGAALVANDSGANGSASDITVASGGVLAVVDGAHVNTVNLAAGAQIISTGVLLQAAGGDRVGSSIAGHVLTAAQGEYVLAGGTATAANVSVGGLQEVFAGGVANKTSVGSGGTLTLSDGHIDHARVTDGFVGGVGVSDGLVVTNGSAVFDAGSVLSDTTLTGSFLIASGTVTDTTASGGSVELSGQIADTRLLGGTLYLEGSSADDTHVEGGVAIFLAAEGSGTIIDSGGVLIQSAGPSGADTLTGTTVNSGGRLVLQEARGSVNADTQQTTLHAGGQIDLATLAYSAGATAMVRDHTLTVRAGATVKLSVVGNYAGAQFVVTSNGAGGTLVTLQAASGGTAAPLAEEIGSAGSRSIADDLAPASKRPDGLAVRHEWGAPRTDVPAPPVLHAPSLHPAIALTTHVT